MAQIPFVAFLHTTEHRRTSDFSCLEAVHFALDVDCLLRRAAACRRGVLDCREKSTPKLFTASFSRLRF